MTCKKKTHTASAMPKIISEAVHTAGDKGAIITSLEVMTCP